MKDELRLIGVAGQRRNGKDTVLNYLSPKLLHKVPRPAHGGGVYDHAPWRGGSFASAVKQIYCDTFGKDMDFVEEWKVRDEVPPGMDMAVRPALVFIGNGFRQIQSDIWIETAFRPERDPFHRIYSDLRYVNEARKIKSLGGVSILIYREGYLNWDDNDSEAELRPYIMWCREKGDSGVIADWDAFKTKDIGFRTNAEFAAFFDSLPASMKTNGNRHLKDTFFGNLSQFDIFLRSESGVENIHQAVDTIVLPYLRERYIVEEAA